MTAISHEAHAMAERDLPCNYMGKCNSSRCPCRARPTVATTYQRFMDEIAELGAENVVCEEEIARLKAQIERDKALKLEAAEALESIRTASGRYAWHTSNEEQAAFISRLRASSTDINPLINALEAFGEASRASPTTEGDKGEGNHA